MPTVPNCPSNPPLNPFWLNAVQTLVACNMLAIFVPFAIALIGSPTDLWRSLGFLLSLVPFWAPFVWVFWRLSARADALTVKRSLALAASWAFLVFALASMSFWAAVNDEADLTRIAGNSAIIAVIQAALILASIKTYFSMKRQRSDFYLLIPRLGAALFVLGCVVAFLLWLSRVQY